MDHRSSFALAVAFALTAAPACAQAPETPDLVVLITVDQLRPDYLVRYRNQFTGGFKRMLDQGAVFTNAFHDHAVTETAVGHASLLSGRFPRSVGIISNRRGVADPQSKLIGKETEGASPFRFRGSTLIDWLRLEDPLSRALSVSVKDRGAILPLGRAKENVFWWHDNQFGTSTYYADTLPTWVGAFNDRQLPDTYKDRPWTLLLEPRAYSEPDSVTFENSELKEIAFPHVSVPFTATPWMDEVVAQFAVAGLNALQLGRRGHVDVLAVSFSTTDYIGHRFGPDSREIHDQILRLDRTMGVFLDSLYAHFAPEEIALVLSADHGVTPFPQARARNLAEARARIVDPKQLLESITKVIGDKAMADGAATLESGMLMMEARQLGNDEALMDSAAATFARAARAVNGVLRVDFVRDLARQDTTRDAFARRWHHTIPPDRAIPVVVTLKPDHVWSETEWAHHGSPHDIDAQVPIIFLGPDFKTGSYHEFVRTVDIAPTLARLLRVQPTERLDGKPLTQALR
jgi:predicted AlkP superfamily pyrophosphatase or phosphodiesterase